MEIKKEDIEEEMGLKVGRDVKSESSTHDQNVEEVLMRFREQKEGLSVTSVKDRDLQRIKVRNFKGKKRRQLTLIARNYKTFDLQAIRYRSQTWNNPGFLPRKLSIPTCRRALRCFQTQSRRSSIIARMSKAL